MPQTSRLTRKSHLSEAEEALKAKHASGTSHFSSASSDLIHSFRSLSFFSDITEEDFLLIQPHLAHRQIRAHETLIERYEQLHHLVLVHAGKLKIVRYSQDGEEILIDLIVSGACASGELLFSPSPTQGTIIALEHSSVFLLALDGLQQFILKHPLTAMRLLEHYHGKLAETRQLLEIAAIRESGQRVARVLLEMHHRLNTAQLNLTQEEIAHASQLSFETVNRRLATLRKMKMIAIHGQRQLEILELDALKEYCEIA